MTLHTLGDSHAWLPFLQIPEAVTHYYGAITMKRAGHPEEHLLHNWVASLNPCLDDSLILSAGEIDVRCWAHVHATQRGKVPAVFLADWVCRYLDKAMTAPANGARVAVLGIVPPTTAAKAHNIEFPVAGSDAERVMYTGMANAALASGCPPRGLTFLDVYSRYAGPDGMMIPELADNSVHVGDATRLRDLLVEHGLIEKS